MTLTGYVSSTFCLLLLDLVATGGVFTSQSSRSPVGLSSWELHASFIEQGVAVERDEGPQRRLDVFHIKLQRERARGLRSHWWNNFWFSKCHLKERSYGKWHLTRLLVWDFIPCLLSHSLPSCHFTYTFLSASFTLPLFPRSLPCASALLTNSPTSNSFFFCLTSYGE